MFALKNKTALVTGAARGLGAGIALALAEAGANVIVNDFRADEAAKICKKIAAMRRKTMCIEADVSDATEVKKMFASLRARFQSLDILVNNAGTSKDQNIFETAPADWDYILKTNLTSAFLCCKAAISIMRRQRSGRIINIVSVAGQRGALYGHVHYAATKSGLIGFTKTLARTAAPYNITVNAIAPGIIATDLLYKTHGAQTVRKLAASVPLGLGTARDIGLAAVYLAGEGGRYITGATLDVNGGMNFR